MSQHVLSLPIPDKGPSRKFFHGVGPTFSVTPPTPKLQFLDNSDPSKGVVVEKKAPEWAHQNKDRRLAAQKKQKGRQKEERWI
jgi:hypothetical protein